MRIFKFGGASVKDAHSIQNIVSILKDCKEEIVVVVSAMGKTTNALEEVLDHYMNLSDTRFTKLNQVYNYHLNIINELFSRSNLSVATEIAEYYFKELNDKLQSLPSLNYHYEYDQIVSYGEILSTAIIAAYLNFQGINCKWIDIRSSLKTNSKYREARVNFEVSADLIPKTFVFNEAQCLITQGFIASDVNSATTTLGREGSDFSAALLAFFLNADDVTIWKDVPGILNADPKWFDDTVLIEKISYHDAIELAYYGASVIHPKTIQPLKKKEIKLFVRSFVNPELKGTVVGDDTYDRLIPCFIFKVDQVLIEIESADYSFIAEDKLEVIFGIFARHGVKINLMQNTAVSFAVCVNNDSVRNNELLKELDIQYFNLNVLKGLELITSLYYNEKTLKRVLVNKKVILEQRTKEHIQIIVQPI